MITFKQQAWLPQDDVTISDDGVVTAADNSVSALKNIILRLNAGKMRWENKSKQQASEIEILKHKLSEKSP